jgi:hypothetical protein
MFLSLETSRLYHKSGGFCSLSKEWLRLNYKYPYNKNMDKLPSETRSEKEIKKELIRRKILIATNLLASASNFIVGSSALILKYPDVGGSLIAVAGAGFIYSIVQLDGYFKTLDELEETETPKKNNSIRTFTKIRDMFGEVKGTKHDKHEGSRDRN